MPSIVGTWKLAHATARDTAGAARPSPYGGKALGRVTLLPATPKTPHLATNYRESGLVVCPACSIAWGWKSPVQPDGGEGLAKHKGVIARWRLKAVWSKTAT